MLQYTSLADGVLPYKMVCIDVKKNIPLHGLYLYDRARFLVYDGAIMELNLFPDRLLSDYRLERI